MANTAEISINGRKYELCANNRACQAYASEFWGMDRGGYNGYLPHDSAQLFSDLVRKGDPSEDGSPTYVVSLDYIPPTFWGIMWALVTGARSTTLAYAEWFEKEVADSLATPGELADAAGEVVDLATRSFFREREEQAGGEPATEG
jgi:hypothetical protein